MRIEANWSYSSPCPLTQWYGHVGYFEDHVIGQWMVLDAETGVLRWSHGFDRPNTICGFAHGIIVASETRSDGPWTADFGIYGISAHTGELLWVDQGKRIRGWLARWLDHVPGFTNELRDSPRCVMEDCVVTSRGRVLDVKTGQDCPTKQLTCPKFDMNATPAERFYNEKSLPLPDGRVLGINWLGSTFNVVCTNTADQEVWRFSLSDHARHMKGDFYSFRLHDDKILMVLGDAPATVPIDPAQPGRTRVNRANYQLGVLNVSDGQFTIFPLAKAEQRESCRIEDVRDDRLLISCDTTHLTEYSLRA